MSMSFEDTTAGGSKLQLGPWLWLLVLRFFLPLLLTVIGVWLPWRRATQDLQSTLAGISIGCLVLYATGGIALLLPRRRAALNWVRFLLWAPVVLFLVFIAIGMSLADDSGRAGFWDMAMIVAVLLQMLLLPVFGWSGYLGTPEIERRYPGRPTKKAAPGTDSHRHQQGPGQWRRTWFADLPRRVLFLQGIAAVLLIAREASAHLTSWLAFGQWLLSILTQASGTYRQALPSIIASGVLPIMAALLLLWSSWSGLRAALACLWLMPMLNAVAAIFSWRYGFASDARIVLAGCQIDLAAAYSAYLLNAPHITTLYPGRRYSQLSDQVTDVDVF
jgi:MFS family permease